MVHGQPAGSPTISLYTRAVTRSSSILCSCDAEVLCFCVFKEPASGRWECWICQPRLHLQGQSTKQPAMLQEINISIMALLQFLPSFLQVSDATKLRPKVEFCFGEFYPPVSSLLPPSYPLPFPLMMSFPAAHMMLFKSLEPGVCCALTPGAPHLRPCFLLSSVLSLRPSSPPFLHFLSH